MKVFLVQHARTTQDEEEDVKIIGVYSSEEMARSAIKRLSSKPGFADPGGEFFVDAYDLDRDHWEEGFVTVIP
jgi:hypothetical protein